MRVGFNEIDLAVGTSPPYGKPLPTQKYHVQQPPPEDDATVRDIALILAAGYTLDQMVSKLSALLPSTEISVIKAVVGLASSAARPRVSAVGPVTRLVRGDELYFRAAYIIKAAKRVTRAIDSGKPIRTALADESTLYRSHQKARQGRLEAADAVDRASKQFGDLLGWYLNPLLNNEIECIKANGHNFHATEGTVIGWPGTVHPNCGCKPGPPIPGAGMVNDAVKPIVMDTFGKKVYLVKSA